MVVDDTLDNTIDWLHARRSRLGDTTNNNNNRNSSPDKDNNNNNKTPTQLLTPGQAEVFQHQNSHIPIHMYTLFTTSELSMSLLAQGGTDIHIINTSSSNHQQHDNSTGGAGGVGIGCDYILLCTGRNPSHIRVMADSIVRNLKLRKLHERNVLGAIHGIEGGQDIFSNKRSRNRARKLGGGPGSSGRMDDDWIVIDCDNIHVHILDDVTRKCLNIESLWDLSNPNSEGSKLRRINLSDDDAMDEYVTQNPIPDEYAVKLFNYSSSSSDGGGRGRGRDGWFTGGAGSRVQTVLSSYKRKSFSDKWNGKGSSSSSSGKKGRRGQRAKSVR
jgi:ribosomal silencing factor RsfS